MKYIRKFSFISLIIVVAIAGTAVPAFAADINDVYNDLHYIRQNQVPDIQQIRAILYSQLPYVNTHLSNIYNYCNTYLPSINDIKNASNSIDNRLTNTNTYLNNIQSYTQNLNNIDTTLTNSYNKLGNIENYTYSLIGISSNVNQLKEVLASDEDLAIRQGQATRVDQIEDDFLDSSGSASVSLGDLGSAKDSVSQIKGAMSGGASASSLWNVLANTSNAWSWFSQATADDLDTTSSSSMRSSSSQYTYLNEYYRELGLSLGGNYND